MSEKKSFKSFNVNFIEFIRNFNVLKLLELIKVSL